MFHVNPQTGDAKSCSAKVGNCPFGSDSPHFETQVEAQQWFEESQKTKDSMLTLKKSDSFSAKPAEELWAQAGGRQIFAGEVKELLTPADGDTWLVASLKDGTLLNRFSNNPLIDAGATERKAESFRQELLAQDAKTNPLARVINGAYPLDEARDYLAADPKASVKEASEAAFSAELALVDPQLKEDIYTAAEARGRGARSAILNEYAAYAELVDIVRQPKEEESSKAPVTDEGRAVAEAKNPLVQAFNTFRGKTEFDRTVAQEVLEQAFPVYNAGLSTQAKQAAFEIAEARADDWGSFIEEYRTAASIASSAKDAPKRYSPARLPRNAKEVQAQVKNVSKAKAFKKATEKLMKTGGENVQETAQELLEGLKSQGTFPAIFGD